MLITIIRPNHNKQFFSMYLAYVRIMYHVFSISGVIYYVVLVFVDFYFSRTFFGSIRAFPNL